MGVGFRIAVGLAVTVSAAALVRPEVREDAGFTGWRAGRAGVAIVVARIATAAEIGRAHV